MVSLLIQQVSKTMLAMSCVNKAVMMKYPPRKVQINRVSISICSEFNYNSSFKSFQGKCIMVTTQALTK